MHMFLLLFAHIYVFWVIPLQGNLKLYGTSICKPDKVKFYGCKDFHTNPFLMIFYGILCIYFLFSSLQLRYGFPIMKKSSSVLQYHGNIVAVICASIYWSLPFIIEIRCLLDFTMSKTSLDMFQYWQLFQYNFDMFVNCNGNLSYTYKVIGQKKGFIEKFFLGFVFSAAILCVLCGPMVLFSNMSGFVAPNPVISGDLKLEFIIRK